MLKRTLTALSLIALLAGVLAASYFVSHIFVDMFIWLLLALAVREMYKCLRAASYKVFRTPYIVAMLLTYPAFYLMEYYLGEGILGILLATLVSAAIQLAMYTFADTETYSSKDLYAGLSVLIYPITFISLAWVLSFRYSAIYSILLAVFLPVGTDTFAYWFGSMIGGKKLCPKISPKKTVAGAVGGLLGGMTVSVIFFLVFEYFNLLPDCGYIPFTDAYWKSALVYLAIGFAGATAGQLGDLAASRVKRSLGVKDFGTIFPGHGGVMDRMDSIMFCLVVITVAFTIIYGV